MKQVSHGNYLMRNVLKHNVVFNEGTRGDAAYILTEGKIEISGIIEGHKKVFAILKPISIFGEMALFLDDNTRTATAIALEDSKVIVVTSDDLEQFMRESPKVISSIITVLVGRLKTTTKKAMKVPSTAWAWCASSTCSRPTEDDPALRHHHQVHGRHLRDHARPHRAVHPRPGRPAAPGRRPRRERLPDHPHPGTQPAARGHEDEKGLNRN